MYVLIFILGTLLGGLLAFCFFCMFAINAPEAGAERRFIEKQERTKEGGHRESSK
ncbi:MAG: hypothetical protein NC311_15725 [Muribaculaceae bacterium]|nr:hypothetical protein [Muribaculaceae bacterium]